MRKILVLRGGALGDFIVTLPALALLRERWPGARIELVGNATAAALAREGGLVDAVHSQHEARWSALYATAPLPPTFAGWLAEFDLVLNYWPDPDGDLRGRFPFHRGQIFLAADAHPATAPAAAYYCEPLRALGLTMKAPWHRLTAPVQPESTIAIHPGSGSARKNWPPERWHELCTWLSQTCRDEIIVVTGEAEAPGAFAGLGTAVHGLPVCKLATHLARCRLFLGHDSGVSHLAAACGVPSILLFGPTEPAIWAPPAPDVRVLRLGPDLAAISVADVQQEILGTNSGWTRVRSTRGAENDSRAEPFAPQSAGGPKEFSSPLASKSVLRAAS